MSSELMEVIADDRYPQADLLLRQGKHLGTDGDASLYDFIHSNQDCLASYYRRYGVLLQSGPEGYFYLLPVSADRAPLGRRHLGLLDMLVGQTLALMMLDPQWLETNRRIPDLQVLASLEQLLGTKQLLRYAGRKRGQNDELDAQKLRESLAGTMKTLERLGFIKREGRGESAVVIPLSPVMRFADPVRTSTDVTEDAMRRLIQEGQIDLLPDNRKNAAPVDD
ncbi:chromosome partition protein MukE [Paraburkholderia acidipaludis]|uniref:chromosome partition protein MukE n=1 Tax=Paraburkholderia acidipaludis TaxID=660537 RepID=UPI0005B7CFEE|nr:chromosome partition protein MukE [Paraburkholderia acidipaludis]